MDQRPFIHRQQDVDFIPFGEKTEQEQHMETKAQLFNLMAYCKAECGMTDKEILDIRYGKGYPGKPAALAGVEKGMDSEQPQGEDVGESSPHGTPETAKDNGEETKEQDSGGGSSSEAPTEERRYSGSPGGEEGSPEPDARAVQEGQDQARQ